MVKCDYLYHPETFMESANLNYLIDKKLSFRIIENGVVVPNRYLQCTKGNGGIFDDRGKYITESYVHHGMQDMYTPNEEPEYIPMPVIYYGMLADIWGHCVTDNIKRIWFFKTATYRNYFKNLPIVCTSYGGVGAVRLKNFFKLLNILGLDPNRLIFVTKPTKFQNIILPDESFSANIDTYFTKEFEETVEQLQNFAQKNFRPITQKKFYLFHGRNQIGEERVANYFASKGYTVIRPEKFPLEEQLNIYANCTEFASPIGSIAHNTIFTQKNTNAIFIPRMPLSTDKFPHQLIINDLRDLNVNYIDSTLSTFSISWKGPYLYIISRQLKEFFGDTFENYDEDDLKIFALYLQFAVKNNIRLHEKAHEYYKDIFNEILAQLKQRQDLLEKFGIKFKETFNI